MRDDSDFMTSFNDNSEIADESPSIFESVQESNRVLSIKQSMNQKSIVGTISKTVGKKNVSANKKASKSVVASPVAKKGRVTSTGL